MTKNSLGERRQPFLSVSMIVKNESLNLERCLSSIRPYVDEMVVVDTGSRDGTTEIAAQYGAKVSYFEWCDDFAAARNYALSQVSGEWILVLDADEELVVKSNIFLDRVKGQPETLAYFLLRTEETERGDIMTPLYALRLFRNLPEFKYIGRFHEQLTYNREAIASDCLGELESVQILHHGYRQETLQQKNINRNIPILERIREEEGLSLMLLYCLMGMYNATEQPEKAAECYVEAFDSLFPNLIDGSRPDEFGMVPSLVYTLGAQAIAKGDYETARLLAQRGLEWCPQHPPLNYLAGFTLLVLGFPLGALAYFESCLQLGRENTYYKGEPFEKNFITVAPACGLGKAYMQLRHWTEATAAFKLALSFDSNCAEARHNLEEIRKVNNG